AGGVAGQLEDLSGQVLHDGCQVDGRSCSHSLGVVALAEETVDSADWKLETHDGSWSEWRQRAPLQTVTTGVTQLPHNTPS
ncbi:hypothetical protein GBAR_LOCUS18453, partial [Geodia barretti]